MINIEKIGVYIAGIGFLSIIWASEMSTKDAITDIKERLCKLETNHNIIERIAKLEGKSEKCL